MSMNDGQQDKGPRGHRKRQAGPKAEKKKEAAAKKRRSESDAASKKSQADPKRRNPKAFAVQRANKTAKIVRRTLDLETAKHHIPMKSRDELEPPPVVVAIVGGAGVGKSTLLTSLVKSYTRQKLTNINGPVTVVSGKRKRLTFVECNNDVNVMIDVAKVADLVLLMINAELGWDMAIFEFINICQTHGFPKIIGVLNHLEAYKDSKALKKYKKRLKHRFWQEVYQGAKLFYLTKLMNGEYLKNEVHNLGRFISVMKFRPLPWRMSHPYMLCDRFEDVTDPQELHKDEKCDRSVLLYGYVRGAHLRNCGDVHVPGCGDFVLSDATRLPDPCPMPGAQGEKLKKRALNLRERALYAPMSGVGGLLLDKDAVYIHTGGSHHLSDRPSSLPAESSAPSTRLAEVAGLDRQLRERHQVQLLSGTRPLLAKEVRVGDSDEDEEDRKGEEDDDDDDVEEEEEEASDDENEAMEVDKEDDDDEDDSEKENGEADDDEEDDPIESMKSRFNALAGRWSLQEPRRVNWHQLVYGRQSRKNQQAEADKSGEEEDAFGLDGLLRPVGGGKLAEDDEEDRTLPEAQAVRDWSEGLAHLIENCFVTGKWRPDEDAANLLGRDAEARRRLTEADDDDDEEEEEEEGNNDDAEAKETDSDSEPDGEVKGEGDDWLAELKAKQARKELTRPEKIRLAREKNRQKKAALKAAFDAEYDAAKAGVDEGDFLSNWKSQVEQQAKLNREQFDDLDEDARVQLEGFRPGMYVRVELRNVPCELTRHFDPAYPLIVGGLLPGESATGLVRLRFKHHRWYKKILKTRDPLVFSAGWRRFQSLPIYSVEEHNGRHRYLKYTPEHQHCDATIFGPLLPHNTGVLAVQSVCSVNKEFRIAGLGVVLEKDHTVPIMKKLKLIGEPFKVFKKTAFVAGMFTSKLEVAKFVGAKVQTVSGVRGMIKKPLTEKEGAFRATFEDRILLSDLVFCRCWAQVEVPNFFNPVTTLLLDEEERLRWRGVRTVGQIRAEKNLSNEAAARPDSQYQRGDPVRKNFVPLPLKVPKQLQRQLPYRFKPKSSGSERGGESERQRLEAARPAVVREPHESKRAQLVEMLREVHKAQQAKRRQQMVSRARQHQSVKAKIDAAKQAKQKVTKKRMLAAQQRRKGAKKS